MTNNLIAFGEVLISQAFRVEDNTLKQVFSFNKRDKFVKYIKDHRYLLYNKFEQKIRDLSLGDFLYFIKRIDLEDRVEIHYELDANSPQLDEFDLKATNFKLVDYVPPTPGCPFCKYKVDTDNELFFFCEAKQKTLTKEIKNCKYFKQKKLYKS